MPGGMAEAAPAAIRNCNGGVREMNPHAIIIELCLLQLLIRQAARLNSSLRGDRPAWMLEATPVIPGFTPIGTRGIWTGFIIGLAVVALLLLWRVTRPARWEFAMIRHREP